MSNTRHDFSRLSSLAAKRLSRRDAVRAGAVGLSASGLASIPGVARAAVQDTGYGGEEASLTYGFWDASQRPAVEEQIAAFNVAFPNITVEPQVVPFDDYWTKLQTGIAGGSIYDVFWSNTANLPVFAAQGALLPIEPIIAAGGATPIITAGGLRQSSPRGGLRGSTLAGTPTLLSRPTPTTAFYSASHETSTPLRSFTTPSYSTRRASSIPQPIGHGKTCIKLPSN